MLRNGELEQKEIEVGGGRARPATPIGQLDMPGMPPGQMINLGEMMKGMLAAARRRRGG